jgi:hypothetical protein
MSGSSCKQLAYQESLQFDITLMMQACMTAASHQQASTWCMACCTPAYPSSCRDVVVHPCLYRLSVGIIICCYHFETEPRNSWVSNKVQLLLVVGELTCKQQRQQRTHVHGD